MRGKQIALGALVSVVGVVFIVLQTLAMIVILVVVVCAGSLVATGAPAQGPSVEPGGVAAGKRLLIVGDSITQGSSGDYTWRYRLWRKLQQTAPGVSFVGPRTDLYNNVTGAAGSQRYQVDFSGKAHAAKWGTTFLAQLPNIQGQVARSGANVLVIALGLNDLSWKTSPAQTAENARRYIRNARAANPTIDVVIAESTYRYDPWKKEYYTKADSGEYASLIAAMAKRISTSSSPVVIAHNRDAFDPKDHTYDGVHPNPTGETILAQKVSEALAQVGVGSSSPNIIARKSWPAVGPTPSLDASSPERMRISWDRNPTGATGMVLAYKVPRADIGWTTLPIPATGDGWTMTGLIPGDDTYIRLKPAKGLMSGQFGSGDKRYISAEPFGNAGDPGVVERFRDSQGRLGMTVQWKAGSNATGYALGARYFGMEASPWDDLPLPVTNNRWTFNVEPPGRYRQYRVKAQRGWVSRRWVQTGVRRTLGLAASRSYAALGDSYSSGLGSKKLSQYSGGKCYRSDIAWAYSMQAPLNSRTGLFACAGNITSDIPGQMEAAAAFFRSNPMQAQVVTMTIGGNDAGFSKVLSKCVFSHCDRYADQYKNAIDNVAPLLGHQYQQLRYKFPFADILVGGYPAVVDKEGNPALICRRFSASERAMMAYLSQRLNHHISDQAKGVKNVWSASDTVYNTFVGMNSCNSQNFAWINSAEIGGASIISPNSFHPNAAGQLQYAKAFSDVYRRKAG